MYLSGTTLAATVLFTTVVTVFPLNNPGGKEKT